MQTVHVQFLKRNGDRFESVPISCLFPYNHNPLIVHPDQNTVQGVTTGDVGPPPMQLSGLPRL
jgi:hypothetical protein